MLEADNTGTRTGWAGRCGPRGGGRLPRWCVGARVGPITSREKCNNDSVLKYST
jgi:hypothetical protein